MRVLFLTDSLSDLDGVGRYAVALITALERQRPGLEVEVLLARKHRPTSSAVPGHWRVSVALPPDYLFYMAPTRFWPSLLLASARVFARARHADLVHAIKDYPHSLVGLLGARLAGRPCVATAHGTYTIQPLLDGRHARLARWTYARFARLISVSRYTRDRLLAVLGASAVDPARVVVVPNAVDADHFARAEPELPRPWGKAPYTLTIGEIKERKGHHVGLAAWCRVARGFPALHHVVVGRAHGDEYERALRELVRAAGLEARVHFLGNVSEADKLDLLKRAELFLHTPVTAEDGGFEGFGLVYLEASASGIPVIGTTGCGAEDAIDDGSTGLVVEPAVEAVEAALRRLLGDPALRARMGRAGAERARASSWDANARAVLGLYAEVLA